MKDRANQTLTKPNCNFFNIWEHSLNSWCSCSCLHPMRWQISCYLGQSEDRGCSIALHNSWLIYFALSFIHLLGVNKLFIWMLTRQCSKLESWSRQRQQLVPPISHEQPGLGRPQQCSAQQRLTHLCARSQVTCQMMRSDLSLQN